MDPFQSRVQVEETPETPRLNTGSHLLLLEKISEQNTETLLEILEGVLIFQTLPDLTLALSRLTCPGRLRSRRRTTARRWGRPQAVCGSRWAPEAPCPARRAVACRGRWGPWSFLRRGKAGSRGQVPGRDLPGWTGPDRAWDCWRSTPSCWLSRDPVQGRSSWHWGPRHSAGAEGSYLERGRRELLQKLFHFCNFPKCFSFQDTVRTWGPVLAI